MGVTERHACTHARVQQAQRNYIAGCLLAGYVGCLHNKCPHWLDENAPLHPSAPFSQRLRLPPFYSVFLQHDVARLIWNYRKNSTLHAIRTTARLLLSLSLSGNEMQGEQEWRNMFAGQSFSSDATTLFLNMGSGALSVFPFLLSLPSPLILFREEQI